MESGIKQNAVSFSAGMSNVPNDLLCSDDACSEVVGLTSENGEMKPIQMPRKVFLPSGRGNLVYVHQLQTGKVYLYYLMPPEVVSQGGGYNYTFRYEYNNTSNTFVVNTPVMATPKVTSIGNTLIVTCGSTLCYFLWDGSQYKTLGSKIPELQVKFWLGDGYIQESDDSAISSNILRLDGAIWVVDTDQEENWNNYVVGEYAKLCTKVNQRKAFVRPFFALAALELYDGSYYMATSPVALYPNINVNFSCSVSETGDSGKSIMRGEVLCFSQSTNYSAWSDIVKGVTIFVTEGVDPCDTGQDAIITPYENGYSGSTTTGFLGTTGREVTMPLFGSTDINVYKVLVSKTAEDVVREMSELSVFYRLCNIGTVTFSSQSTAKFITAHTIENITTQMRLDVDGGEYFDHVSLYGNATYSYNGRLHMANIQRGFFDGFKQFISKDNNTSHTVRVAIDTPMGKKIVTQTDVIGSVGHYFYYPDPRAKVVEITTTDGNNQTSVIVKNLEEHKGLNGAYCIVSPLETLTSDADAVFPSAGLYDGGTEPLPNKVLVSEVDNPFVFRARGYNTVGKGEVMAIASNTTALSEGQFGQFPLYAFATDGIWALGTNATGTYSTVAPMSREVCNNPDSVTQTDSAVFFTSEKGLMVVAGSKVQCVSEQLNGKTETWGYTAGKWELVNGQNVFKPIVFKEFLSGCTIAYDYRDSLLWLLNKDYMWHYVFNIKSGTWALVESNDDDPAYLRAVSDYPDTLLQDEDGWVSTLLGRLDQNDDNMLYTANITTRPMKFGNALTLKSIREMKHLAMMGSQADVQIRLYASNDCRQWVEVRSLRGKPWKYYRVKYHLSRMLPTDRFIGTVFRVKETRDNKLR